MKIRGKDNNTNIRITKHGNEGEHRRKLNSEKYNIKVGTTEHCKSEELTYIKEWR